MPKIYCAGPLFNSKEKEEMQEIAHTLEKTGFAVFLPQRDGFEFSGLKQNFLQLGYSLAETTALLNRAIFTLDVYHVLDSDGLVLNINGRVPDEGAMVEAGIAWNAGKKIVIYKSDSRSLMAGNDNPLLLGLAGFQSIDKIQDIPASFAAHFMEYEIDKPKPFLDNTNTKILYNEGKQLAGLASRSEPPAELCRCLVTLLGDEHVFTAR